MWIHEAFARLDKLEDLSLPMPRRKKVKWDPCTCVEISVKRYCDGERCPSCKRKGKR